MGRKLAIKTKLKLRINNNNNTGTEKREREREREGGENKSKKREEMRGKSARTGLRFPILASAAQTLAISITEPLSAPSYIEGQQQHWCKHTNTQRGLERGAGIGVKRPGNAWQTLPCPHTREVSIHPFLDAHANTIGIARKEGSPSSLNTC